MKKASPRTPKVTKAKAASSRVMAPAFQTGKDLMIALLILSVLINLFVFIGWIALQVTDQYDSQVATLLFKK